MTAADTLDMSVEERLELVGEIWAGIEASPQALALHDDEREEIGRRLEAYRHNRALGDPWNVVRERVQRARRRS